MRTPRNRSGCCASCLRRSTSASSDCSPGGWAHVPATETIAGLFERQAAATPAAIALVAGAERVSYRELDARAAGIARQLGCRGVVPGQRVAVCLPRSVDLLAAILGVLKAGAAYVPLDPDHPAARLQFMMRDVQATALLTTTALAQSLSPADLPTILLDEPGQTDETGTAPAAGAMRPAPVTPDDVAYVLYTSGTTGQPKGVIVTHANLVGAFHAWRLDYGLLASDVHLQMAGFAFDVFTGDWVRALLSGARLVLCPREVLLQPEELLRMLQTEHISVAEFVPAVMRPLMAQLAGQHLDLAFMRLVIVGSDVWHFAEHRQLAALCGPATGVVNSYGVAEATIDSTFFEGTAELAGGGAAIIGRPFANTSVAILDGGMQPLPVGIPGELWIGGAGVSRGYQGKAALTATRFVERDGKRWYRSGDRVRLRADGQLEYLGRLDEQLKLRGFRIEPGEIETVLAAQPGVAQCAVVLRQWRDGDQRLVAYAVAQAGCTLQWPTLRAALKRRLPDYLVPAALVVLEGLPLSANGKVARRALPVPDEADPGPDYVGPRSALEQLLCELYAEVLGSTTAIGIHADFFALGGHSLLATQLVSRIRAVLEVQLPLKALFEGPTVAELAAQLSSTAAPRYRVPAAALPPAAPTPSQAYSAPAAFSQQRLWFLDQLAPGNPAYNLHAAWQLQGELDGGARRGAAGAGGSSPDAAHHLRRPRRRALAADCTAADSAARH